MEITPKVLIGIPTYDGHGFCLDRFLKSLGEIEYSNKEILFVDNSETEYYADVIRSKGFNVIWNKDIIDQNPVGKIVSNMNIIRKYLLENDFEFLFILETDILVPSDSLKKLMTHNKDIVSGVYLGMHKEDNVIKIRPVIYELTEKEDYLKFTKIGKIRGDNFFEIAASGFGCCLIKKTVLEKLDFFYNKDGNSTHDVVFCFEARKRYNFKTFADTSVKCIHMKKEIDIDIPLASFSFTTTY